MEIFISQTQLEVDQADGITWLAQDQQRMFFRRGLESADEDTTLWFLIEWRDIPSNAAPRAALTVNGTTWGFLKTVYKAEGNEGRLPG